MTWSKVYRVGWNNGEAHFSRVFESERERDLFTEGLLAAGNTNVSTWEGEVNYDEVMEGDLE